MNISFYRYNPVTLAKESSPKRRLGWWTGCDSNQLNDAEYNILAYYDGRRWKVLGDDGNYSSWYGFEITL